MRQGYGTIAISIRRKNASPASRGGILTFDLRARLLDERAYSTPDGHASHTQASETRIEMLHVGGVHLRAPIFPAFIR